MKGNHILIIDDEEHVRKSLSMLLTSYNYITSKASNDKEAIDIIKSNNIDVVLCDVYLSGSSGIDILKQVQTIDADLPVIMMTAYGSVESAVKCMSKGAYNYIPKPIKIEALTIIIEKALAKKILIEENILLRKEVGKKYNFSNIIACSKSMQEIIEIIKRVSDKKSSVLISGESGTGKELIAKAIHFNSPRRSKSFVVVNCGAIPHNLLESEFFGHKKGSFTGAFQNKMGLMEQASEGTIFFDEIGELNPELQVKVLRAIQEDEITPVGDTVPKKINLRILAATNKKIMEEVQQGNFREDLYYRLCVVSINIPPLRERKEDIPVLINHYFKFYKKKFQLNHESISNEALKILMGYDYPGNVRELQNILESSLILSTGKMLKPSDLQLGIKSYPTEQIKNAFKTEQIKKTISQEHSLKRATNKMKSVFEKEIIEKALHETNYNIAKTAKLLQICRATLYNKIYEYQIKISN